MWHSLCHDMSTIAPSRSSLGPIKHLTIQLRTFVIPRKALPSSAAEVKIPVLPHLSMYMGCTSNAHNSESLTHITIVA